MPNVSLTAAPTDYTAEAADIARRRKMAEMLQAQGMAPIEQQTAGGYVIPTSWTQGLAKALQSGSGAMQQNQLKAEEKALAERYRTEGNTALATGLKAWQGSPERPAAQDPQELAQQADQGTAPASNIPAVAPDKMAAMMAFNSHPATQGASSAMLAQIMQDEHAKSVGASFGYGAAPTGGATSPPGAAAPQPAPAGAPGAGSAPATVSKAANVGIPANIARGLLIADPTGKLLGEKIAAQYLESTKLQNVRPGGTVYAPGVGPQYTAPDKGIQMTQGPQGTSAAAIPGYAQALAAQTGGVTGATEDAKAARDIITVNTEGAPTLTTRAQAIGAVGGGAQRPPVPGATTPPGSGTIAPERIPDQLRILQEELAGAQRAGDQKGVEALNAEIARVQRGVPGLRLQDQGAGAQQKSQGAAQGELEAAKPQQALAARTSLTNLERLHNIAGELVNHKGIERITGKVDQYPMLDMTDQTRAARALQGSLVKQMATSSLAAMREASKTGGAVGAVTEKEWPILEQQLAAVDAAQSPADYKVALQNLQNQMQGAMGRIRSAYQETYKEPLKFDSVPYKSQGRRSSDQPSSVRSQADAILGNR